MKRIALITFLALTVLCACAGKEDSVVGKWIDSETEAMYEYTADGYYYEYVNENFTTDKTRYSVSGGKITYYIDGENPGTGFSVDYEITHEGNLVINGTLEYRPLTVPEGE